MSFKFELNDQVFIKFSKERGFVAGRAEYMSCDNSYLLKYTNNSGVAVSDWWTESDLEKAVV